MFFGCLSFVAIALLMIYKNGDTNDNELVSYMQTMTLLNAMGKTNKMWVVLIATFAVGIGGHIFVYMFETSVNLKESSSNKKKTIQIDEQTICAHALLISNINTDLTVEVAQQKLEILYRLMLGRLNQLSPVLKDTEIIFEKEAIVVQMVCDLD